MSERNLRVALFAETYLPYLSGVTISTEALARGLGRAGHDVLLVAPAPVDRDAIPVAGTPGAAGAPGPAPRVAWLPSYQAPGPVPRGYRMPWPVPSAAFRAAAVFAPQIVHAQSPFVSGLMARGAARRASAPLVFTHHTRFGDYSHYLGWAAAPGTALVEAYLQRWWAGCAAVVAPGSALAAEIGARLGPHRRPVVRMIPTGVDLAGIRALPVPDPRRLAGWPSDAVVVVSVGRLAEEKNVRVLVDAFARAAAVEARARFMLVGDGPALVWVRDRIARADLAGRVHLAGALPHPEALGLAAGADLFAFASHTETQGLVLAEAAACGLPVVALRGPGVDDAVVDDVNGIVVEAEPAADAAHRLAEAIGRLVADRALRTRLAAGAIREAQRFDLARRIGEVEGLYRELLAERR